MTGTLLTTVLAGAAQHKSIDQKVDSVNEVKLAIPLNRRSFVVFA